ncbi:MAG: hypothetical protein ACFFCW_29700 [Candidatus Hodarchaeota archaeon]
MRPLIRRIFSIVLVLFVVIGRYIIGSRQYSSEGKVTELFIVRGLGSSYVNFNLKFILVVALFAIIYYDWRKNQRLDYLLIGLLCAAGTPVEAYVQLTGRRIIQTSTLFGFQMPFLLQLSIQSLADSSFDVVLMLFFADRMMDDETKRNARIGFIMVIIVWIAVLFSNGVQTPNYGGEVASRRVISGTGELAVVLTVTLIVLEFFFTENRYLLANVSENEKRRGLYLFALLIIYGAAGTLGMYFSGQRWVEIGVTGASSHASLLVETLSLSYNFTFEYASTYMVPYIFAVGLTILQRLGQQKLKK